MCGTWRLRLLGLFLVASALLAFAKEHHHDDDKHKDDKDKDKGKQGKAVDFANPAQTLSMLATLPPEAQAAILSVVGSQLQVSTGTDCNIFGGKSSCKALPKDSAYVKECPCDDARVDCIFFEAVQENLYSDPFKEIQDAVKFYTDDSVDIEQLCPECLHNARRLWCAQSIPACGAFEQYVQSSMLPALAEVADAYAKGKSEVEAMAGAVEMVLKGMGAVLPCREMCQSVVDTCGCGGTSETFGSLLSLVAEDVEGPASVKGMDDFTHSLFKNIWNRPLCDLFLPNSTAGFAGRCDAPNTAGRPGGMKRPADVYGGGMGGIGMGGGAMAAGGSGGSGGLAQPPVGDDVWLLATCTNHSAFCNVTGGSTGGGAGSADGSGDLGRWVQAMVAAQLARSSLGWMVDRQKGLWASHDALARPANATQVRVAVAEAKRVAGDASSEYVGDYLYYDYVDVYNSKDAASTPRAAPAARSSWWSASSSPPPTRTYNPAPKQEQQQQSGSVYVQPGDSGSSGGGRSAGQIVGIVFLSCLGGVLAAGAAWQGMKYWRSRQRDQRYMELQSTDHFAPLAEL